MIYPITPWIGRVCRLISPRWQHEPFSGEGARRTGGRWNVIGTPALYATTDPITATAEYYQGVPKPGMLAPYAMSANRIADLTDGEGGPADPRVADALEADWKMLARIQRRDPPSWVLAAELIEAGAEGALVPSAQHKGGTNLVLWRWHDALGGGDGASLELLDPQRTLGKRGSR